MRSLDEIRLFQHLAGTRHFGRTSVACHVSQPTLSRTISRLETELGFRLFERDRRNVSLTTEGIRFRAFADQVLSAWDDYSAGSDEGEVTGSLSLFCTVTAAQTILPELLVRFRDAYPEVHLALETGYAADALRRLEDGTVDVTVAPLPTRVPRHLLTHVIATTSLVLVTQADGPHHLAPSPSAEWSRVPFVLPTGSVVRSLVDRWFRRHRVRPSIAAEEPGHEALLSLVTLGFGVGIVPELVAAASPLAARLSVLPISVAMPTFDIAVCTTADRLAQRTVGAFWNALGERAAEVAT